MTASTSDPKHRMSEHVTALRSYAEQVIVHGAPLTGVQEEEKETRFREFADLGDSMHLTERDMVLMMLDGLFHKGPKCGCTECRVRDEMEHQS